MYDEQRATLVDEQRATLVKEIVQSVIDAIEVEGRKLAEEFPTGVAPAAIISERLRKAAQDAINKVALKHSGQRGASMKEVIIGGKKTFVPIEKPFEPALAGLIPLPMDLINIAADLSDSAIKSGITAGGSIISNAVTDTEDALTRVFFGV